MESLFTKVIFGFKNGELRTHTFGAISWTLDDYIKNIFLYVGKRVWSFKIF